MHVDLWLRSALRRAAIRYANRGWPVLPGASLIGDRYVCGPLCPTVGCHPAIENWERRASVDGADVDTWWAESTFSVLLATGRAFDVIEVPARIGRPAAAEALLGPVAVAPTGRWMFLVEPGQALRPELARQLDVVLHGSGSWIPAPPTRTPIGRIRWHTSPTVTAWQLPDPYVVQKVLVCYLRPVGREPTPAGAARAIRRVA